MEQYLISIILFLIGFAAGTLLAAGIFRKLRREEKIFLEEQLQQKEETIALTIKEKEETIRRLEVNHKTALELLQNKFDSTVKLMQEELKNLTNDMLKKRQKEFQESSSEKIDSILSPLNESIKGMKLAMDNNSRLQHEFSGLFSSNVENLLRQSEAARLSAERLANALGNNSKIQGNWGETILTELLESQGLTEGRHFDTQYVMPGNTSLRPDVVLHLDNERDVIIDAKVSLSDYLSYLNADTDAEREMALRRHIASIENHVKELVRKDYSSLVGSNHSSIGYVIMFVPNTSALLLATNAKPELWRKAMEQNVYIADEQTLYAALKIVRLTWSRIAQNENHKEVYALANEMLERVAKFMEKYVELGSRLDAAAKAYTQGYDKIKEGGHSIPNTCRKLIKMGAKMERRPKVPDALLGLDSSDDFLPSSDSE